MKASFAHTVWMVLALAGTEALLWASDPSELEAQIADLRRQQVSLQGEREALLQQAQQLAAHIDALRQEDKGGLGGSERRLTRKLQESVELSQRIDALSRRIDELTAQIAGMTRELKEFYEQRVAELVRQIDLAAEDQKEGLTRQALMYLAAKLKLEGSVVFVPDVKLTAQIEATPQDGPEEIRQKADLVSDVADKLTAQLALVDVRLRDLGQQQRMRRKMREFAEEITFFDEDIAMGRTVRPSEAQASGSLRDSEGEPSWGLGPSGYKGEPATEADGHDVQEPVRTPIVEAQLDAVAERLGTENTPWTLGQQIDSLNVIRGRLQRESAALRAKAERLYRRAETME